MFFVVVTIGNLSIRRRRLLARVFARIRESVQIFAAGMRPEMSRDHIPPTCGVGALRAAIRFLSSVRPLVSAEMIRA